MPLYLAPYIGTGTRADPFRPRGSDQPGWSAIRLATAASRRFRALLWLPAADADPQLDLLGLDKRERLTAPRRARLGTVLGLTLADRPTVADVLLDLLTDPPANGWNALRPARALDVSPTALRWEVWLNGERWIDLPYVAGGATVTEDFATDENPLSYSGKWSSGDGDWDPIRALSGRARQSTPQYCAARLATPAIGADQYSQGIYIINGATAYRDVAMCVRMAAGADESSYVGFAVPGTGFAIYETDASKSFTAVTGFTGALVSGHLLRLEITGSSLTLQDDGATVRTGTDSTIATGQPGFISNNGVPGEMEIDTWEGGDLGALPLPVAAVLARAGNQMAGIGTGRP